MKHFIEQARNYVQSHQKKTTLYFHFVGVPLITFALMVFAGFFHLMVPDILNLSLAALGTLSLLVYYFFLHWRLAAIMVPILLCMLWLSTLVSHAGPTSSALWTLGIIFVIGALLQAAAHFLEGTKPAFTGNITQALIAPMLLVAEVCFLFGYMRDLQVEIHA
jgi:uncharacterized membrane protein YGL010W